MKIRMGGFDDIPALLDIWDGTVAWLVEHGRTGQWGTEPMSSRPGIMDRIRAKLKEGVLWVAELDGRPVGMMVVSAKPMSYVAPADEPELYLTLLITDRSCAGRGVGAALIEHARQEAAQAGVGLLRVDCYAGSEGALIDYYRRNGFTPTEPFTVGDWPGQLLEMRI